MDNKVFDTSVCSICYKNGTNIYFDSVITLFDHYKETHKITSLWWCNKCNIYYHDNDDYESHMDKCIY